jgi:hypothetical protein
MEPITEQELRAFVGRKADYYLGKWWPALKSQGSGYDQVAVAGLMLAQPKTGFNWAAFLLSGLWLPYRKMYKATFIFMGIILLESILEEVLFVGILGKPEPPAALGRLVGLVAAVICGAYGNRWYLSHAQKMIFQARSEEFQGDEYVKVLAQRGGTSLGASLGMFVLFIVAIVAVLLVLEVLFARG